MKLQCDEPVPSSAFNGLNVCPYTQGLLDLETDNNQLTPILASLVTKDAKLLDFVTHEVEVGLSS